MQPPVLHHLYYTIFSQSGVFERLVFTAYESDVSLYYDTVYVDMDKDNYSIHILETLYYSDTPIHVHISLIDYDSSAIQLTIPV